ALVCLAAREVLRGEGVDPFEAGPAGDHDDVAVAAVEDRSVLDGLALLGQRLPVVPGDTAAVVRDRSAQFQQRGRGCLGHPAFSKHSAQAPNTATCPTASRN